VLRLAPIANSTSGIVATVAVAAIRRAADHQAEGFPMRPVSSAFDARARLGAKSNQGH
jgi:hypothetical protein